MYFFNYREFEISQKDSIISLSIPVSTSLFLINSINQDKYLQYLISEFELSYNTDTDTGLTTTEQDILNYKSFWKYRHTAGKKEIDENDILSCNQNNSFFF